jgi:hypothetical protein
MCCTACQNRNYTLNNEHHCYKQQINQKVLCTMWQGLWSKEELEMYVKSIYSSRCDLFIVSTQITLHISAYLNHYQRFHQH